MRIISVKKQRQDLMQRAGVFLSEAGGHPPMMIQMRGTRTNGRAGEGLPIDSRDGRSLGCRVRSSRDHEGERDLKK
jgi:hypothetical protein